MLWVGYFYLMRHALSVVLTACGLPAPWGLQFHDISVPPILDNIQTYAAVITINGSVFITWAVYNKIMFGSRNRRRHADPVTPAQLATIFRVSADQVRICQKAQRMTMIHDESGNLIQCDNLDNGGI